MNPQLMTNDELYQQMNKSLDDAKDLMAVAMAQANYSVIFRQKSNENVRFVAIIVGGYAVLGILAPFVPEEHKGYKGHLQNCEREARIKLKDQYKATEPTAQQIEMVRNCADEKMSFDAEVAPYGIAAVVGLPLVFLAVAGVQRWKASLCNQKNKHLIESSYFADAKSADCAHELQQRSEVPVLELVQPS